MGQRSTARAGRSIARGRARTAIDRETTARERQRTACGRDTLARGNVRTAFRAARRAFWNERIARHERCPARRTAAFVREHVSEWPDLRNGARASVMFTATARRPTPCHNDGGRMNAQLRRRLEMAGRVRDFLRAHKTDAVGEGLGLAKLEELIARAEALDGQQ